MGDSEFAILGAVASWREAASRIEHHRPKMARAELSGDPLAITAETDEADRLFDELHAARNAVYGMAPPTLKAAAAMLTLMLEAEEDTFDDPALRTALESILHLLRTSASECRLVSSSR